MEEKTNKEEAKVIVEAFPKQGQSSKDETNKPLNAKPKIGKKPHSNRKPGRRRLRREREAAEAKKLAERNAETSTKKDQDLEKLNSEREKQHNNANKEKHTETVRDGAGGSDKKQEIENKPHGSEKGSKDTKSKEKHDGIERSQAEKKEKLGGLIFMCSSRTKPDCFRYNVMGVSMTKKDLVLSVKPGLKLFLYDFELQLMYGIYQASSSGGLKLEPKAFGGAFPAQVKFSILKDCYPIPEMVFKNAIKENYNDNRKFKIELTVKQVRKLTELFRPATFPSGVQPVLSPPRASIRDKEVCGTIREARNHSSKANDTFAEDPHAIANGKSRHGWKFSDEGGRKRSVFGEVASRQIDEKSNLFMSEKEYRAYGLQGGRNDSAPLHHTFSPLDPIQRRYERDHFQRPLDPVDHLMHRDTVPTHLTDRAYQTYDIGSGRELSSLVPETSRLDFYSRDPYAYHNYGASSTDPYLAPPRRKETFSGSYRIGGERTEAYRTDNDRAERLYSSYAADSLSDYNRRNQFQGVNPEAAPAPVSSRDAFAGPSMSYR